MKPFNILSIFLSLVLIALSLFFISEVSAILERMNATADFNQKIYLKADSYEASVNSGLYCAGIVLFLLIAFAVNSSKSKTKMAKRIGVFGLIISILVLAFNVFVIIGPKLFGFAEYGYVFTAYGVLSLIFSVILLSQSNRHQNSTES